MVTFSFVWKEWKKQKLAFFHFLHRVITVEHKMIN